MEDGKLVVVLAAPAALAALAALAGKPVVALAALVGKRVEARGGRLEAAQEVRAGKLVVDPAGGPAAVVVAALADGPVREATAAAREDGLAAQVVGGKPVVEADMVARLAVEQRVASRSTCTSSRL